LLAAGESAMSHWVYFLVGLAVWLFFCIVVGRTATALGRPAATWFLIAVVISPLAAYVLLLLAGDAQLARALREKEERIRRLHPERTDIRDAALNETTCPACGAVVNPVTGDGLYTAETEPWLLFCDQCQGPIQPDV
jgi:hypothetical protein